LSPNGLGVRPSLSNITAAKTRPNADADATVVATATVTEDLAQDRPAATGHGHPALTGLGRRNPTGRVHLKATGHGRHRAIDVPTDRARDVPSGIRGRDVDRPRMINGDRVRRRYCRPWKDSMCCS
jgi:hypothetical protein